MRRILSLLLLNIYFAFGQVYTLEHSPDKVVISEINGGQKVIYERENGGSVLANPVGAPDLPVYVYRVKLSSPQDVRSVKILESEEIKLEGRFQLNTVPPPLSQKQKALPGGSSAMVMAGSDIYPQKTIQFTGVKYFNGQAIAHFVIYPLRYNTKTRELYLIKKIRFAVETEQSSAEVIQPFRPSGLVEKTEAVYSDLLPDAVLDTGVPAGNNDAWRNAYEAGLVDRYIIITTDELASAFEPLAEWKTKKGVPTIIRTVSWIIQNFPEGVDDAERMRNYLRWSYEQRGTKYVLMGGDMDIVPTRIIKTGGYTFPTDYYFADLDGTWNADQDNIFGEADDELDGYPELYIGRYPAETSEDVQNFLRKLFEYEKLIDISDPQYPQNVLFTAGDISKKDDSKKWIEDRIDPQINPDFPRTFLTQNNQIGSDGSVAWAELNKSYGLIFTENHGTYDTYRPGAKGSNIYTYQLKELNSPDPAFWYMASCETNDIRKRSFSEMFMLTPKGGVAFIGNTSWEYPVSSLTMQEEFYRLLFSKGRYHLSEAHYLSRLPYLAYLSYEGPSRIIVYSTLVLGDPEMPVWTDAPQNFAVAVQDSFAQGSGIVRVTVTNQTTGEAVEDALVVLYKKDTVYKLNKTDEQGTARFDLTGAAAGEVALTVSAQNYIPYESSLELAQLNGPALAVQNSEVQEVDGNNNNKCEPGEILDILLNVKNIGGSETGAPFRAILNVSHPQLEGLVTEVESSEGLAPQETGTLLPFRLRVDSTFASDPTLTLRVNFEKNSQTLGTALAKIKIGVPRLRISGYDISTLQNDSLNVSEIKLELYNYGMGGSRDVSVFIRTDQDSVVVENDSLYFGNIASDEKIQNDTALVVTHNRAAEDIQLRAEIRDHYGNTWKQNINFKSPEEPTALNFKPVNANALQITWKPADDPDVYGYNVYRKTASEMTFVKINAQPVVNGGYFVDENIDPLEVYEYVLDTVDSLGNFSGYSTDTLTAWSAVPSMGGFPRVIDPQAMSSEFNGLQVADLTGDGANELIVSSGHGFVRVYNRHFERQAQFDQLKGNSITPAIGNVYGDASPEIVVSTYTEGSEDNYVYILDARTEQIVGELPLGYNAPGPVVLNDLDRDGYDDIIVLTHGGNSPLDEKNSRLYVWRSEGQTWSAFSAWQDTAYYTFSDNWSMGVPASADLNRDGEEWVIAASSNGKIYAFKPAESNEPVWIKRISGADFNTAVSLADINADDSLDVIVPSAKNKLYVLDSNGAFLEGWEDGVAIDATQTFGRSAPAIVAQLDEDEFLEIIYLGKQNLYVFEHNGNLKDGWPIPVNNEKQKAGRRDPFSGYASPLVADLDQDGTTEIVFMTTNGYIHAINVRTQNEIIGFPMHTENDYIQGQSPLVNDIDRDGDLDIAFVGNSGILYLWDYPQTYGQNTELYWHQAYGNLRHSGVLDTLKLVNASSIDETEETAIPDEFFIKPNYPNPFNPQTTIEYGLSKKSFVRIQVFNILGQTVKTLVSEVINNGTHRVTWNGTDLHNFRVASGIYFYRLEIQDTITGEVLYSRVNKMLLVK